MSRQKFRKEIVFIVIFPINVTTKVCNSTEINNCRKRKLFRMSRQCRTPSKVAHVIRTLSQNRHFSRYDKSRLRSEFYQI